MSLNCIMHFGRYQPPHDLPGNRDVLLNIEGILKESINSKLIVMTQVILKGKARLKYNVS